MTTKNKKDLKKSEELQKRLMEKAVEAIMAIQNDIPCMEMLNGTKHVYEGVCDDIFDAIKKAAVDILRKGKPFPECDRDLEVIGDIAPAAVDFLEKIAFARIRLDGLLKEKCARLVNGSAYRRQRDKDKGGEGHSKR